MKKISLQIKITIIASIFIVIPIVLANIIFEYHKTIFENKSVIAGARLVTNQLKQLEKIISREEIESMDLEEFQIDEEEEGIELGEEGENEEGIEGNEEEEAEAESESDGEVEAKVERPRKLSLEELKAAKAKAMEEAERETEIQSQKIEIFKEFINDHKNSLDALDNSIESLKKYADIFMLGSIIFACIAISLLWSFMDYSTHPIKGVMKKLKNFQNESDKDSQDMLECVFKFDSFLSTSRTLLKESYSIAREIGSKLEPLTVMSVFSDDNVKSLFTDVQAISRSSNYIANTLESTTSHIQEVSASAQTIADRSHEAATDSAETAAIAGEGKNAVSETIDTMESIKDEVLGLEDVIENLNSASIQIGEIVNTITNIAYQTNLLALNAAIEAARAGEHGQGFTVVAGEVKKLAEESGEAAEDISKKIKEMLKKTGKAVETINRGATKVIEGVNIANLAGNNLDKIVASVSNVNKMIQDISNASTEQSENIDSLRGSIESITGATKMTSEGTKRVATAVNGQLAHIRQYISVTKELLTLVQMMGDMLDKFNLN